MDTFHPNIYKLQDKIRRLNDVIDSKNKLSLQFYDSLDDEIGHKCDRAVDEFLDIFFKVANKPIRNQLQLQILNISNKHMLEDDPVPFMGSIEEAIDAALQDAIDDAKSPIQTGLFALIRYRIESQRRQLASA